MRKSNLSGASNIINTQKVLLDPLEEKKIYLHKSSTYEHKKVHLYASNISDSSTDNNLADLYTRLPPTVQPKTTKQK